MQRMMERVNEHGLILAISEWGIASRIGDDVIVNKNIFNYPDFAEKVISHELRHNNELRYDDLVHDMTTGSLIENLRFCFKHPKAFTHFIPFGFYRGAFYIDLNMIIAYVIVCLIIIMILGLLLITLKTM